jgi:tetratricopeptide (TPR) repeat protein
LDLYNLGQFEDASRYYNMAGRDLDFLGLYNESIGFYDRALEIDLNNVRAIINKGFALSKLGQYEEAIEYYDKVLTLNPNDVMR